MSFSTSNFEKWMKTQGSEVEKVKIPLTDAQIKILKEYPEVREANDLPFEVQEEIIALNEWDVGSPTDRNLQGEVDAFLANQYSLVTRNFIH
jgi:hypothetical protein|tara:strand:+ start:829 stop:1104 length:276 start_codon:yes stop_codon:yes gene_type:complete